MDVLNARSILVTGSNRGIGLELVRQLAERRNRPEWIFATCRDPEGSRSQELKNLAAKHQEVKIIQLDTTDPSSIEAAVATVTKLLTESAGSGLNLLVNNAGIAKKVTQETPQSMSEIYETNVIGPMMVSQAFLPLLKKASQESPHKGMSCSKAAIINMSSEAGSITNVLLFHVEQVVCYRCSKAALNMLTKCQSLEFGKEDILCIALHPGWVETDMGNLLGQPPLTVELSVKGILKSIANLSAKDNGAFVDWEGKAVPW